MHGDIEMCEDIIRYLIGVSAGVILYLFIRYLFDR